MIQTQHNPAKRGCVHPKIRTLRALEIRCGRSFLCFDDVERHSLALFERRKDGFFVYYAVLVKERVLLRTFDSDESEFLILEELLDDSLHIFCVWLVIYSETRLGFCIAAIIALFKRYVCILAAMGPKTSEIWDVAVIGGGPAGMMAAGRAAELGKKVILIEKNKKLGEKLLITGGGRCNVTNAEFDTRTLLAKFKEAEQFLFSAFAQWNVQETIDFFNNRGMETKIEAEKRVFPVSNKSQSVWDVLVEYMKEGQVTVLSDSPVSEFVVHQGNAFVKAVKLANGKEIRAKSFILATGGMSRPETGSTGDGFGWLRAIGHTVVDASAALVPLAVKDEWVKKLQGISLPTAKLTSYQNGVKQETRKGKMLFTHFGISGPAVLNMSSSVGELLKYGDVTLALDLLPTFDHAQLNTALQELFKQETNKKLKNALPKLIPSAFISPVCELANIDGETFCNTVSREQRMRLIDTLKGMEMQVKGLLGMDKAIIASGGVALDEIDSKTMQSKRYPNLYIVGDVLNIDRPSGGYSLQLCWTTGRVAGEHA